MERDVYRRCHMIRVAKREELISESWRAIYSCIKWLRQVDLVEPIHLQVKPRPISSDLKARLRYRHVAVVVSIGGGESLTQPLSTLPSYVLSPH